LSEGSPSPCWYGVVSERRKSSDDLTGLAISSIGLPWGLHVEGGANGLHRYLNPREKCKNVKVKGTLTSFRVRLWATFYASIRPRVHTPRRPCHKVKPCRHLVSPRLFCTKPLSSPRPRGRGAPSSSCARGTRSAWRHCTTRWRSRARIL